VSNDRGKSRSGDERSSPKHRDGKMPTKALERGTYILAQSFVSAPRGHQSRRACEGGDARQADE